MKDSTGRELLPLKDSYTKQEIEDALSDKSDKEVGIDIADLRCRFANAVCINLLDCVSVEQAQKLLIT